MIECKMKISASGELESLTVENEKEATESYN